ncbi:DedA family protein [Streptomyces sp. NPDC056503]|uniref:DedA family protein n=1 Tax=Streptomyces sp. NPDC056503 TaxID=3345842 RepID=UPI0036A36492
MNTLALGPSWLDPDYLIQTFGLIGVLAIVFAESGLLIGFFLPGDSLLFTTGLLVTTGKLDSPLWLVCTLVVAAAIIGDQVGYLFGRKVGPSLFRRPDSKLFKQENVEKAHEFFEKHGPKSLILARFVPIIRTFTPIIAGVSRMNYRSFITFNVIGGVLWGAGVTLLGASLGKIDFVHRHIEAILIGIVLVSVVPIVIEYLRARSQSKKAAAQGTAPAAPAAPDEQPGHGRPGYGERSDQSGYGDQGGQGGYGDQQDQGGYGNQGGYAGQGGYGNQGGYAGQAGYDGQAGYGNQGGYAGQAGYDGQGGYDGQAGYAGQGGYGNQGGYAAQGGYGDQAGYAGQAGYGNQGGYAGQGGYDGQAGYGYGNQPAYGEQPGYGEQGGQGGYGAHPVQGGYGEQGGYGGQNPPPHDGDDRHAQR